MDAAAALPVDVLAAVEAAHVFVRSSRDENGGAYVLVRMPGLGSWTHNAEETRQRLAAGFPELSEGQLERAYRFLANRIAKHVRSDINGEAPARRKSWIHNW
ncbi:hypothetical protein [uncultured Pseudomonas sp.]|uniref:hypothetical protein n=1 Tax=uncultured Pseudomonas sp. TaxID=114707 RepID=UPI00258B1718|nr:hypothetical protein [uncultured Pseudomonas sp.]